MQGKTFYRPARAYPPVLPEGTIVVSAPPVVQSYQPGTLYWLMYLLPALGGMGSVVFIFAFRLNPLLIAAGILIGVCALGSGVAIVFVQRGMVRRQRRQQSAAYLEYLSSLRRRLMMLARQQREADERLYPSHEQLANFVERREYLWERRPGDLDFLRVRIGAGPGPLCCSLKLDRDSNNFMVQFVPELLVRAEAVIDEYSYLSDLAATIPLRSLGVLSLNGKDVQTRALVRALLCHLTAFHAPQDLRCLLYFPATHLQEWEWFKWLPHGRCLRRVKDEKRSAVERLCMIADNGEDLQALLQEQVMPELERRHRLCEDESGGRKQQIPTEAVLPHLVLVLDGFSQKSALGRLPELDTLLDEAASFGITVICLVEDQSQEPAQVQARLSISAAGALNFEETRYGGRRLQGLTPDSVEPRLCECIARSMAPLVLTEVGTPQDLTQDIRLLDLIEIPSVDVFDPSNTWRPRTRSDFLSVPIGQRADGRLLYLDLKEAADGGMGPHGLLVGATGSGKSELLRTLVMALAMTHDPQELNFVLIDFKGGAAFFDFEALPHVAGIVTNLESDPSLINRVYSSLLGEQQRRQHMLHEAGNLDSIKQYQAMRQQHPEMEPMPHVIIVVDEFAELIANNPDFLDLFVTMGRIGRSLGLHLFFATQRLEEGRIKGLESHLRYRICLRTFSAIESRVVLGKSDAYYLPAVPGMGYFKVDTDIYDLFKTALISAPYVAPQEKVSLESRMRIFGATGKLRPYISSIAQTASLPAPGEDQLSVLHTEMDVIIERIARATQHVRSQAVHQVWLPPLEKMLPLSSVLRKCQRPELDGSKWETPPPFGELRVPAGLVDIPLQQVQEPLWLDFSGVGGHLALVGTPQSGKSAFLRTLLTTFMITHSPRDVQFYCIDMGGGLLRVFEQAPHVGAICGKAERDKVQRLVRQMVKIIEEREFLFREHGIDSMATFRVQRRSGPLEHIPFGDVFLIIDNFAQFFQEFEQLEPELLEIVASGLTYGVHLVVATNRWAEIRPKLRDNIGTRLELRLNDPLESELGKAAASSLPVGVPGRGANRDKLHFQIALPLVEDSPAGQDGQSLPVQEALRALVQRICAAWKGEPAPPVHVLPAQVHCEDLPAPDKHHGVPLGLEEFRLSPFFIDLIAGGPHFIILGDTECGKTSLLRTWMRGLERCYLPQEAAFAIVDFRKQLLDFSDSKHLLIYAYNSPTLTACIGNLKVDLERRLQAASEIPINTLRKPQIWNGRHYFLFVDDYETLMTAGISQLAPLADYLLSGREIGFHLVLTHRVSGVGRASYETVFQRLREMGTPAILMSGDPTEGKFLYGQGTGALPAGRGYLIQPRHAPLLVQAAFTQPEYSHA